MFFFLAYFTLYNRPLRCEEARDTGKFSNGWCLNRVSPSTLRVPFQSPLEASLSLTGMVPVAQCLQGMIQKDFAVDGSDLIVSVLEEFPLGVGGQQVLWSELPLKSVMMEILRGLV